MKNLKELKPLIDLLKKDKWKLFFWGIVLLICESCSVLTGYLNGSAVEAITKLDLIKALTFLGLYFIYELIIDGIIYIRASNSLVKMESKLTRSIGYEAYRKALNMPAYAYEEMASGEIINRITNDADVLSFTFRRLVYALGDLVACFVLIFYIFYNSWIVGLEIIVLLSFLFILMKYCNPKMKAAHKERKQEQDRFASLVNESIRGVREIKTLGVRKNLLTEMKEIIEVLFSKSVKEIKIDNNFSVIAKIIRVLMEVGVFVTCAILLYNKNITLTFFIAMTYYVYRFMYLIDNLSDLNQTYQRVIVALGRINEIVLNKKYKDEEYGKENFVSEGVIEFKNVTFGYPKEKPILNNFNLKLLPNKKIAIVGKSGQGKSTIFNLLTRVFDTKNGSITLDGVDIKDLDEETLRNNISIIRQEPFVFNRTIKDNFKVIDKNIKLSEIREYCKMAYLDDYIMSLPKKYNTLLGEGGVNLSGGQKQRLAIARTLIKKSKVILFDEATSALDNSSQEYIKKTINNLVKDHTVIVVAHRLSTIEDADIIYVIDKGQIAGSGTHKELLKTNKIYKKLYENESLNSL